MIKMVDMQIPKALFYGMNYHLMLIANEAVSCGYPFSTLEAKGVYVGVLVETQCPECAKDSALEYLVNTAIASMN